MFDAYANEDAFRIFALAGTRIHHKEFLSLRCRNCQKTTKLFAVILNGDKDDTSKVKVMKVGENPRFGDSLTERG